MNNNVNVKVRSDNKLKKGWKTKLNRKRQRNSISIPTLRAAQLARHRWVPTRDGHWVPNQGIRPFRRR